MFTLINLPYAPEALEPVISAKTLGFHHGKHLQGYVNNLNAALTGSPFAGMAREDIIRTAGGGSLNNAGQILNHNLYFEQFGAPVSGDAPRGALAAQIAKQWGSLEAFQTEFVAKGAGLFGSGWVWLQADAAGELSIAQYAGADNPVAHGFKPLLTFDVWEHAYYLDYQNRRPDYLKALWPLVNWRIIEERYGK